MSPCCSHCQVRLSCAELRLALKLDERHTEIPKVQESNYFMMVNVVVTKEIYSSTFYLCFSFC